MAPTGNRGRILVVEDDALLRRILVRALTAMDWDVRAAEDGLQALQQIELEYRTWCCRTSRCPASTGAGSLGAWRPATQACPSC